MSFIRFGEEGSDVYVYLSSSGFECCDCHFASEGKRICLLSREQALLHLDRHRSFGDIVPQSTYARIQQRVLSPRAPLTQEQVGHLKRAWEQGA